VGVGATSIDIIGASHGSTSFTSYVVSASPNPKAILSQISGAYFRSKAGVPPHAEFSYVPVAPTIAIL